MTTVEEVKQANAEIAKLMDEGKFLEAFDQFYAEGVSMQDNNNPPTVGKAENRKREEDLFAQMEYYKTKTTSIVYGKHSDYDLVTVAIMENDFKHNQFGEVKSEQSAVTCWKDGKIVKENFYYWM